MNGVGEVVIADKVLYSATDVISMLGVSRTYAYDLIKELNAELEQQGFHTIRGKVSRRYFDKKMYLVD